MVLLDVLPVISAIVTIAGLSLKAGRILQKLDYLIDDVKNIKTDLKELDKRITVLETKIA
ncbi:Uncharacterised protein [uncultured archaeon]|nr:Uncharacterised protein [uncultured archaeon]